jgi:hypothetical protein
MMRGINVVYIVLAKRKRSNKKKDFGKKSYTAQQVATPQTGKRIFVNWCYPVASIYVVMNKIRFRKRRLNVGGDYSALCPCCLTG